MSTQAQIPNAKGLRMKRSMTFMVVPSFSDRELISLFSPYGLSVCSCTSRNAVVRHIFEAVASSIQYRPPCVVLMAYLLFGFQFRARCWASAI
jgi:hypothetical protein